MEEIASVLELKQVQSLICDDNYEKELTTFLYTIYRKYVT